MKLEKSRIFYTKPSVTELEVGLATDAARNGWGEKCYDYIHKFEDNFRKHLGSSFAISTSSCTGALHMGLAALNIGPGDEIILADTNWVATVSPIQYLGAKPVFVDILPDSWCIDPVFVEKAITSKTKAIIATHIYGNLCDMDRLLEIGKKHDIPVIEDAAEAIGSKWRGIRAGNLGKFGVFSFHGSKTITTGEGGMFVTNDERLFSRVLTLSNHGRSMSTQKQFWPDTIGFKYKLSNLQAALGVGQLERIESLIARKREILIKYKSGLSNLAEISLNPEPEHATNGSWMPTAVFSEKSQVTREKLQVAFARENVDARVFFWPLSSLPMFKEQPENVNAYSIPRRAINLPSYHDIQDEDIHRVIEVLRGVIFDK